jgi:hypothetical protein
MWAFGRVNIEAVSGENQYEFKIVCDEETTPTNPTQLVVFRFDMRGEFIEMEVMAENE